MSWDASSTVEPPTSAANRAAWPHKCRVRAPGARSASTATTWPPPRVVGSGNAGWAAPVSSAPRSKSCRTASFTWTVTGASGVTARCRSTEMTRQSPTVVRLPDAPHRPGPISAALSVWMSSAGTWARRSGGTLAGSHSRSAQDSSAGSRMSSSAQLSSCSHPTRITSGVEREVFDPGGERQIE